MAYFLWYQPLLLRPGRPRFDGLALGIGFGLAAGMVVSRSLRIPTPQSEHFARRVGHRPRHER